jgi:hypothetical protein
MKKAKEYLIEFIVIFISISLAFLSENWREKMQDKEDYDLILNEIHANLLLDSIEFVNDISFIEKQITSIDRLLDAVHPCPVDSLRLYFDMLMYNYRWPDVKATGIDQLRNSKNLDPGSELISEVNNYYTWTEYLKESTPYQYILPQSTFNDWMVQNLMKPLEQGIYALDPVFARQMEVRLHHLRRLKQMQMGVFRLGLSKIVNLLNLFEANLP